MCSAAGEWVNMAVSDTPLRPCNTRQHIVHDISGELLGPENRNKKPRADAEYYCVDY
jgi:hypothetical protein